MEVANVVEVKRKAAYREVDYILTQQASSLIVTTLIISAYVILFSRPG